MNYASFHQSNPLYGHVCRKAIPVNMALSGHAIQPTFRPKARGSHCPPLSPPLKPCWPEMKLPAQAFKRRGMMIKNVPLRPPVISAVSSFGTGNNVGSDSSLQTIKAFYSSINTKDLKSLKALLSEDCFFDDFSFPAPFQGKKVC